MWWAKREWVVCCGEPGEPDLIAQAFIRAAGRRKCSKGSSLMDAISTCTCGLAYFGPGDAAGAHFGLAEPTGAERCNAADIGSIVAEPLMFWCGHSALWLKYSGREDWLGLSCPSGYDVLESERGWWGDGMRRVFRAILDYRAQAIDWDDVLIVVNEFYDSGVEGVGVTGRTLLSITLAKMLTRGLERGGRF